MTLGDVISDDVSRCYVKVSESAMVGKGEQKVIRKVFSSEGKGKFVELNAFAIVNEGTLRLAESEHFVTVKEGAAADPLFEVDFEEQFLLSPIEERKVSLRTREHQSGPVSGVLTLIVSHIETEIEGAGCSLKVH